MNQPYIFLYIPSSWTSLQPPTPSHPARMSQSTRLSSLGQVANSHWLSVLHTVVYVSMLLSRFISHSLYPVVSISLFSMSASLLLPYKYVHQYHFSRFHIYALIYDVFLFSTYFTSITDSSRTDSDSSFYGWIICHCINICAPHLLYPLLSINGHLGCFHVLALVNCCCGSVAKLCLTLCGPMDCSMPGFPVLHHLPEFAQIHVPCVSDAIQPSHPLMSPSPLALNFSQHQGLFQWAGSSHQVAKVLELQLQHQSFQWIFSIISFRIDWFGLAVQGALKHLLQHHSLKVSVLQFSSSLWPNSHIHTIPDWLLEIS